MLMHGAWALTARRQPSFRAYAIDGNVSAYEVGVARHVLSPAMLLILSGHVS
jgi:hypothetical protein